MTFEDMVPPVGMCEEIPEGSFADSAMIYILSDGQWILLPREKRLEALHHIPAPTLAEIMAELDKTCDDVCMWNNSAKHWWNIQVENMKTGETHGKRDRNAAAAALRLWLDLREEGDQE